MLASLVGAIISGILQPLLAWWSTYRQGRLAERAKSAEETLKKERELHDAVEKVRLDPGEFVLGPDGRVYRSPSGPSTPAPELPDPKPDDK